MSTNVSTNMSRVLSLSGTLGDQENVIGANIPDNPNPVLNAKFTEELYEKPGEPITTSPPMRNVQNVAAVNEHDTV